MPPPVFDGALVDGLFDQMMEKLDGLIARQDSVSKNTVYRVSVFDSQKSSYPYGEAIFLHQKNFRRQNFFYTKKWVFLEGTKLLYKI